VHSSQIEVLCRLTTQSPLSYLIQHRSLVGHSKNLIHIYQSLSASQTNHLAVEHVGCRMTTFSIHHLSCLAPGSLKLTFYRQIIPLPVIIAYRRGFSLLIVLFLLVLCKLRLYFVHIRYIAGCQSHFMRAYHVQVWLAQLIENYMG